MSDGVQANPGSGGDLIAADDVGGVKIQRVKMVIGADGVNDGDVAAANPLPVLLKAGSDQVGTVLGPTLTKGTQGATGFSTQDLKDSGRTIVNCATVMAGIAGVLVGAEALVALDTSRGGAAPASLTTLAVTAGKRWRVQKILVTAYQTGATIVRTHVMLRWNPSGAVVITSPIIANIVLPGGETAVANQGKFIDIPIPDGLEFTGAEQFGLSHWGSAAGYVLLASIIGYEY